MGSVNALMRAGAVSGKAAGKWKKPAILSQTRAQKSKMADFDGKGRDEGAKGNSGAVGIDGRNGHINAKQFQADRAHSMPSKGGSVGSSYVPGRRAINQFPRKHASTFPAGAGTDGRAPSKKTGNTRMKGKQPMKSGGPSGGNAGSKSYYGGPKGRDGGS